MLVARSVSAFTLQELVDQPQDPAELRAIGQRLFRFLFHDNLEHLYRSALATAEAIASTEDGGRLRLEVTVAPDELAVMPWELLFDPVRERFLAAEARVSLSRRLMILEPRRAQPRPSRLRVLGLFPETSGLETIEEKSALVSLSEQRGLDLHCLDSQVTLEAVHIAMERFQPHIVHFSGHASYGDAPGVSLDRDRRRSRHLEATSFAQTLSHFGREPAVVVISACEGGLPGTRAVRSVAGSLLRCGVLAVASMQTRIKDSRAALFCRSFYRTLNTSPTGDVEAAVSSARTLMLTQRNHDPSFASPVLFLRGGRFELWPSETDTYMNEKMNDFTRPHTAGSENGMNTRPQVPRSSMNGGGAGADLDSPDQMNRQPPAIGFQFNDVKGDLSGNFVGGDLVDNSRTVNITTPTKSAEDQLVEKADYLAKCGREQLERKNYSRAVHFFNEAQDLHPQDDSSFYLALSLLAGRRPRGMSYSEIKNIENLIYLALEGGEGSHAGLLLAFVKFDYYHHKGMRTGSPTVEDLLKYAQKYGIARPKLQMLFDHMPPLQGFFRSIESAGCSIAIVE